MDNKKEIEAAIKLLKENGYVISKKAPDYQSCATCPYYEAETYYYGHCTLGTLGGRTQFVKGQTKCFWQRIAYENSKKGY